MMKIYPDPHFQMDIKHQNLFIADTFKLMTIIYTSLEFSYKTC